MIATIDTDKKLIVINKPTSLLELWEFMLSNVEEDEDLKDYKVVSDGNMTTKNKSTSSRDLIAHSIIHKYPTVAQDYVKIMTGSETVSEEDIAMCPIRYEEVVAFVNSYGIESSDMLSNLEIFIEYINDL